jgi:hypothetical protein
MKSARAHRERHQEQQLHLDSVSTDAKNKECVSESAQRYSTHKSHKVQKLEPTALHNLACYVPCIIITV